MDTAHIDALIQRVGDAEDRHAIELAACRAENADTSPELSAAHDAVAAAREALHAVLESKTATR